ncbi:MAG TPA: DUF4331 family protein [Dehalococcoidia bacterium]|nr:DUF4331 family protein [Dehalococcoidia bacterium]
MADHLDAPGLKSPHGDPSTDITDIFAFQKPGDPGKSILILNVNPLAPTLATAFHPGAAYDLLVDTDGDARADISFRITFSEPRSGTQFALVERTVRRPGNNAADDGDDHGHDGEEHQVIVARAPVSFGAQAIVSEGRGEGEGYRFFAGLRSDPFFFDLQAFLNGLAFHNPGSDFFKDKNVFGIVLEVPNRRGLGPSSKVGVWARTLLPVPGEDHALGQDDQMGRPAINTVFNHGDDKNLFNATPPDRQRTTTIGSGITFLQSFEQTLSAFGYAAAQAEAIAKILLPDILTYDYASAAGFLNGRRLQDDVIDISLGLVTNGAISTDFVGPHTDYLAAFPFLGNPHM